LDFPAEPDDARRRRLSPEEFDDMANDFATHLGHLLPLLVGVALLIFAALHDIAARTIPNPVCAALAGVGLLLRATDGQLLASLVIGAVVFAVCTACWLRGWMGGGDVKLLTAASLFVAPVTVGPMVVATTLFGGVVAVIYLLARLVARRVALRAHPVPRHFLARVLRAEHWRLLRGSPLPYGSAIAAGTLFVLFSG
jgi:prepilin peptidase CpaA